MCFSSGKKTAINVALAKELKHCAIAMPLPRILAGKISAVNVHINAPGPNAKQTTKSKIAINSNAPFKFPGTMNSLTSARKIKLINNPSIAVRSIFFVQICQDKTSR